MARGNCKKEIFPNDKAHELKPGDIVEVHNPCESDGNSGFIYKFMVKENKFPYSDALGVLQIGRIEFYGDATAESFVEHLLERNAIINLAGMKRQYFQVSSYCESKGKRYSGTDGFLRFCAGFAKPIIYLIG